LDEPFGLALGPEGLSVLLGHYPLRNLGSLVVLPHEFLASKEVGATVPQSDFFADGAFTAPVADVELGEEEPIFMLRHPSGRLLVAAFENDLFALETDWTDPGKLLVIDPANPGAVGKRTLDSIGGMTCVGAWSIVPLDDAMNHVAVSCDGDDGAAVLDVSGIGEGSVEDAAAAVDGCIADVPFNDKRVRAIAPDGSGGFLLVEHSTVADGSAGRLWRFAGLGGAAGDCALLGMAELDPSIFEVREIVRWPVTAGTRWLMTSGRIDAGRGVHVLQDGATGPEVCAKLTELDASWQSDMGVALEPYAIALAKDGTGVAVSAGEGDPRDDLPGYGRVLWAELDPSVDPCTATPVVSVTDLTAGAPAVNIDDPATWRRGPNVLFVQQYGP
ncbi:MAG TPA: hypothetical protein VFG69_11540, partial [Nannocystaceae bacterium]|nr:hypothetical protein [Nannocystaceae bacterium]